LSALIISSREHARLLIALAFGSVFLLFCKCRAILWESVVVYPPNGIQFETHRGLSCLPLFSSRRFIPNIFIRDVIINEGLRRWSVSYYLALIVDDGDGLRLLVAYENVLPRFPVLLEVYKGLRSALEIAKAD